MSLPVNQTDDGRKDITLVNDSCHLPPYLFAFCQFAEKHNLTLISSGKFRF